MSGLRPCGISHSASPSQTILQIGDNSPAVAGDPRAHREEGDAIMEHKWSIAGPVCAAMCANFVHIHRGIHGVADLSSPQFDWRNPVAQVTIHRVR
jgi:hypothetical protein